MTIGVKAYFDAKRAKAQWGEYVNTVVDAHKIARQARLDAVLTEPINTTPAVRIGTRVAYSVKFLRAIFQAPCGELCHWRGSVVDLTTLGEIQLATVQWDDMPPGYCKRGDPGHPGERMKVNTANLAVVGPNSRFNNCE